MRETVHLDDAAPLPLLHCPACGAKIDGATPIRRKGQAPFKPHSGAISICAYCAAWLIFEQSPASASGLGARILSATEQDAIKRSDPALGVLLAKIEASVRQIAAKRSRPQG